MIVSVVGKGRNCPEEVEAHAWSVGYKIAKLGHVVVTGARSGVMLAAARGAAQIPGAQIVGLLPADCDPEPMWPEEALLIRTGLHEYSRNVVVGACCDRMLALPGSHGTAQELAIADDRGIPIGAVQIIDGGTSWPGFPAVTLDEVNGWLT